MQAAKAGGATTIVVTDLVQPTAARARPRRGCRLDPRDPGVVEAMRERLGGPADAVFDCVAIQPTMDQAIALAHKGGTVVVEGVPEADVIVPLAIIQDREIRIQGTAMYTREDMRSAMTLIADGTVDAASLVTKTIRSTKRPMPSPRPTPAARSRSTSGSDLPTLTSGSRCSTHAPAAGHRLSDVYAFLFVHRTIRRNPSCHRTLTARTAMRMRHDPRDSSHRPHSRIPAVAPPADTGGAAPLRPSCSSHEEGVTLCPSDLMSKHITRRQLAIGGRRPRGARFPTLVTVADRIGPESRADLAAMGFPELAITMTDTAFEGVPKSTEAGRYLLKLTSNAHQQ